MKIIIGLGNPGEKYKKTRHNSGFIILDELKRIWNFPEFQLNKKFNAEISESNIGSQKALLAKPQTFMNESGKAVRAILDFYKLKPEDIAVIHDDLDIAVGKYKISVDSSSAGHKGVESIIENIGTQNFKRMRIGTEGVEKRQERTIPADKFVLQNFSEEEYENIKKLAQEISTSII